MELHNSFREGKQSVVAAAPDIQPGMEFGSHLPDENLTGVNNLPSVAFHAASLTG